MCVRASFFSWLVVETVEDRSEESLTSDRVAAAEKNTVSVPEVSASASAGTDAVPPVTDDADDGEQAEEEAMEVDEVDERDID